MMTLRQAHAQWCSVPGNTALGAKTRIAVQKVLLDVCGDMDVTLIDRHYIDLLLKDSKVTDQRFRANAISVLCHILNWLHDMVDSKAYPKPDFDFNIASSQKQVAALASPAPVQAKKSKQVTTARKKHQEKEDKTMSEEKIEKKEKKPRQPKRAAKYLRRSVVQIAADTLQEVARFDTASAAEKALGIKNVLRSIDRHGISGGFYWEFADLFKEGWQPTKRKQGYRREVPEEVMKAAVINKDASRTSSRKIPAKQREFLQSIPDEIILEEIRRRDNWHGTISYITTVTESF